jgi:uncharacterized protein (DUF302 family)
MHTLFLRHALWLLALALSGVTGLSAVAHAADNPAFLKLQAKGEFNAVLGSVKTALEAKQFLITGEENLAKGLENNKKIFGEDKWNTIGFQNATAVHFCSLAFNQEVFNMTMDWSVLCPFKVVLYSMKAKPDEIHIITVRPTYLLAKDPHKKAKEVGKKMEDRIVSALKEGMGK